MKYMTFNSSCSYAGLANLLELYGVDTSDREIALEMGLPYYFDFQNGCYLSGPMLQSEKWFNIYLKPRGFTLTERTLRKEQVCGYLSGISNVMLGIAVNDNAKHAVIYTERNNAGYCFVNNKREYSNEPERFELSEQELLTRLGEVVVVAALNESEREEVDTSQLRRASKSVLQALRKDINDFCARERSATEIRDAKKTLFRAILLDGVTMLDLLGETEIMQKLKSVQTRFIDAVNANRTLRLDRCLDMRLLDSAMLDYMALLDPHKY